MAQTARARLRDDQARGRVRFMRARLTEASARFEQSFRALLALRLQDAAGADPRFAELARRLAALPRRG